MVLELICQRLQVTTSVFQLCDTKYLILFIGYLFCSCTYVRNSTTEMVYVYHRGEL